jgi:hypothetical protein
MNVATNFYVSNDIFPVMPIFEKTMHFFASEISLVTFKHPKSFCLGKECTHWKDNNVKI